MSSVPEEYAARWPVKRLEELAVSIQYGYTAKARHERDGPRYLRITDIQNENVDWPQVPSCEIGDAELTKYRLHPGDLVFARTGATVGKSYLIRGVTPQSVFASYLIRVQLRDDVEPRYVAYFFRSPSYWRQISESQAGIGQPNVNGKKLAQIRVPVAPLDEQREIVAEIEKQFSRLDEAVANLKRVKANLKRYKAAVLKAAVEGRLVPTEAELARREGRSCETGAQLLQRILEIRRGRWKGKGRYKEPKEPDFTDLPEPPEGWAWATVEQLTWRVTSGSCGWGDFYSDTGVLFIRAQDIKTDALVVQSVARVDVPASAEGNRSSVGANDILITITGANVTKAALVPPISEQAFVSQHVALLKLNLSDTASFVFNCIVSRSNGRKTLEALAYGAGKPGLSLEQVRALHVALPPPSEQHRIVAEVDRRLSFANEMEAEVDANLKRVERLRQSALVSAFANSEVVTM